VNDKTRHNRWGIQKIRYELRKKQLPEDLIQEALGAIDPDEGLERLRELLQSKRKTIQGKSEYEIKQKLMRFAVGRGFSPDDIEKALDRI
jgi:regulatory protein